MSVDYSLLCRGLTCKCDVKPEWHLTDPDSVMCQNCWTSHKVPKVTEEEAFLAHPSNQPEQQPSPFDVLYRWPKALTAISSLILQGDKKHRDTQGRGYKIDPVKYDERYSSEKLYRHDARYADGEIRDSENGHPHLVARAWHAINALESWLDAQGYTMEDLISGRITDDKA